ncbi:YczE/YyaS/YitT family protein [Corynebacterium halotolerans]|uniref:YitT family protein n=1 Tax=Corynebacterium halotolerans YIM 70093 = DSM 44683 TaxID=1121362 RepID=M1NPD0_9CORY|nr:DUF6198 family protein [Corynebacterium halotolerans]AGF71372.1 hypothetical protein A605_01790 [Corynebacterium halotolerans YIM 70093 = DSM 44683]
MTEKTEKIEKTGKTEKRSARSHLRRYLLLSLGLSIMALGIAFSIRSGLGTTPISTLPLVLSLIAPLSVGTTTILMNLSFVVAQILILRKRFEPVQLLQVPAAFLFGFLIDVGLWVLHGVNYSAYWQQWVLVLIGIVFVGFGVACQITANTLTLAGEGIVLAISNSLIRHFGAKTYLLFGSLKITFDVSLVILSALLSLLFLHELAGVREGTVLAAVGVGFVARHLITLLRPLERWLRG